MTIPEAVLNAKGAADKVIALELAINAEYKRNKRMINKAALDAAMVEFKHQFNKVIQLHPEWLHLIPNVSKPIFKR
jgi:hypothetical protein